MRPTSLSLNRISEILRRTNASRVDSKVDNAVYRARSSWQGGKGYQRKQRGGGGNFNQNNKGGKKILTCYSCGEIGHKSSNCSNKSKGKLWCGICKSNTHNESSCRKKESQINNVTAGSNKEHSFQFLVDVSDGSDIPVNSSTSCVLPVLFGESIFHLMKS